MKLSQQITVFFLILLSIGSFGYKDYILIDFSIHQDEIAAEHCINKDKPELHCNGKCYLSKELKNIEPNSKESIKGSQIISIDLSWFVSIQTISTIKPTTNIELIKHFDLLDCNYQDQYYSKIFQPPRC